MTLIYLTNDSYQLYLSGGDFDEYPLWSRSLLHKPAFAQDQWLIWQYHNRGRRNGVDGPVDLNVAREDLFKSK